VQTRQRDAETTNPFSKDTKLMGISNSPRYLGDRLMRVARPHKILDPDSTTLRNRRQRMSGS
jgi:predicted oxidoreductase